MTHAIPVVDAFVAMNKSTRAARSGKKHPDGANDAFTMQFPLHAPALAGSVAVSAVGNVPDN